MIRGDSRPVWLRANATEEGRAHHRTRPQHDDQKNHEDRPPRFAHHSASPPGGPGVWEGSETRTRISAPRFYATNCNTARLASGSRYAELSGVIRLNRA